MFNSGETVSVFNFLFFIIFSIRNIYYLHKLTTYIFYVSETMLHKVMTDTKKYYSFC